MMTLKKANFLYCSIQFIEFYCHVLVLKFVSAYMFERGFTNSNISLILVLGSLIPIFIMQLVAHFEGKYDLSINTFSVVLAVLIFVFGGILYFAKLSRVLICVVLCIIITCITTIEISINSIYRGYYNKGIKISFPLARGCGSLSFALGAFFTGRYFANRSTTIMPLFYSIAALILAILLIIFKAPNVEKKEKVKQGYINLLKDYPHFALYLVSLFCFICCSIFTSSFMLQIMQRVGGTIDDVGTALFITALAELPAAFFYKKLSDKLGNRKILVLSMFFLMTKTVLITFAPSPYLIWIIQSLQILGYGLFLPSSERHVAHVVPASLYVTAHALVGSVGFIAHIVAFLFGFLIDRVGIFYTMIFVDIFCAVAIILAQIAINMSYKRIPKTQHKT